MTVTITANIWATTICSSAAVDDAAKSPFPAAVPATAVIATAISASVPASSRYSDSLDGQTNVWLAITTLTSTSRTPLMPKTPKPGKTNNSRATQTRPTRNRMISSESAVPLR